MACAPSWIRQSNNSSRPVSGPGRGLPVMYLAPGSIKCGTNACEPCPSSTTISATLAAHNPRPGIRRVLNSARHSFGPFLVIIPLLYACGGERRFRHCAGLTRQRGSTFTGKVNEESVYKSRFMVLFIASRNTPMSGLHICPQQKPVIIRFQGTQLGYPLSRLPVLHL